MTTLKAKIVALGLAGSLAIIPVFEGLRLKRYRDPIGIWTDCVGHTGPDVRAVNTPAQCDQKLMQDVLTAWGVVQSCVTVPLNPNQRAALVSFAFNVGHGEAGVKDGFCVLKNGNQPRFLKSLNAGNYAAGCYGITSWVNAAGKPLPGLIKRRATEYQLCMK